EGSRSIRTRPLRTRRRRGRRGFPSGSERERRPGEGRGKSRTAPRATRPDTRGSRRAPRKERGIAAEGAREFQVARPATRRSAVGFGLFEVVRNAEAHACASAFRTTSKRDRKSTRLNSSHVAISYAVFCLKKKNECHIETQCTQS